MPIAYVETGVRIPVGTPILAAAQAAQNTGDAPRNGSSPVSFSEPGAYLNYAPEGQGQKNFEKSSPFFGPELENALRGLVALKSSPVSLESVLTRTGKSTYRVVGTIRPGQKPRKLVTMDHEEALATQQLWENERIRGAALSRPKITHLTQTQLREAEAAFEMLKGESFGLLEAVKHSLVNKPAAVCVRTYNESLAIYLARRKEHLGAAHFNRISQRCGRFGVFCGEGSLISSVTVDQARSWINKIASQKTGVVNKKTWNNEAGDLSAMFAFFKEEGWLEKNPFEKVERFGAKAMKGRPKERLDSATARRMMDYLETNHPEWCCYFAITVFSGIRPDRVDGEMFELSRCVARDGLAKYYKGTHWSLTAEITKEGEPRQTTVTPNLAAWLKKYPATPETLCPEKAADYAAIRKRFRIPHDGLRHTAISAFMGRHNSFGMAASEFGNSEVVIRSHYLNPMEKSEADMFYDIFPSP